MANDLTTAGPKTYGGLRPSCTIGADDFAAHNAVEAWADDGAAEAVLVTLAPEVRAYGADQAKQAVLDYTQNAYVDLTIINNEPVVLLDVSNNACPYAVGWKLRDLMLKAIAEAASQADALDFPRIIDGMCVEVRAAIAASFPQLALPPPPVAVPRIAARPVRAGNLKPAVASGGPVGGGRTGTGNRPATQRPGAAHNARVAATPPRPAG